MARLLEKLFVGRRSTYQMSGAASNDDPLSQGLAFQVDYVGYEDMHKEPKEVFSESEKVIEQQLASVPPPYRRLSLVVSDTHLVVLQARPSTGGARHLDVISNIPIYRVFYCGSHTTHSNSICIVAYSRQSKGLKCLVLLCASTKKAQTLVNVVAKAFQNAYMRWLEESKRLKKAKRAAAKASKAEDSGSTKTGGDSDSEEAPAPPAIAAQAPKPLDDRDRVLLDLGNLDISDSADLESERKEMYKTFSKRSKMERPEVLDTGKLQVQPAEVDLNEAAKMVDNVESGPNES